MAVWRGLRETSAPAAHKSRSHGFAKVGAHDLEYP